MLMNGVVVIYGNQALEMVHTLLQKTGAFERIRPNDRVMIKPNLVVSRSRVGHWQRLYDAQLLVAIHQQPERVHI